MPELKEGVRDASNGSPTLAGTCRFGISELGASTWPPRFVARVRAEHPQLMLQPHVDSGRWLERQVVRGELDFAVVPGPPDDPDVASHVVGDVRSAWMAAPGRVRAGSVLEATELSRHPVITMTEGSGLTRAFEALAAEQGLRVHRIVASNSLMVIIGLTMADVGFSFLPHGSMGPWVESRALVALRSVPPLPTLRHRSLHRDDDRRAMLPILLGCATDVAQFSTSADSSRKTI